MVCTPVPPENEGPTTLLVDVFDTFPLPEGITLDKWKDSTKRCKTIKDKYFPWNLSLSLLLLLVPLDAPVVDGDVGHGEEGHQDYQENPINIQDILHKGLCQVLGIELDVF